MQTKEERNKQKREHYHRNKVSIRARQRIWRQNNIEQVKTSQREYQQRPEIKERKRILDKQRTLSMKYGLSVEEYNFLIQEQNGRCYLCKRNPEEAGRKWLVVDHDHQTGKVRSMLCDRCNVVLGLVGEDINLLSSFIEYISSNSNLKLEKVMVR